MSAEDLPPPALPLAGDLACRLPLDPTARQRLWRLAPFTTRALRPRPARPHAEVWLAEEALPFPLVLARLSPGTGESAGDPLGGLIGKRRLLAAPDRGPDDAREGAAEKPAIALIEGDYVLGPERGRLLALDLEGPAAVVLAEALDFALALPLALPPGLGWQEKVREGAARLCDGPAEEPATLPLGAFAARALACRASGVAAGLGAVLALRDAADPEPVHEMRVALRRMRAVLSAFAPLFKEVPVLARLRQALKAELRRAARLFSRARDLDVFHHGLLAEARRLFPEDEGLADLAALVIAMRDEAYAEVIAARRGETMARLASLLGLAASAVLALRPGGAEDPVLFAAGRLERRAEAVLAAPPPETLTAEERHQLRLAVKRLRYMGETFAPLFPGGRTRRMLRRLARLQDWLGHANDARTTALLLEACEREGDRWGFAVDAQAKGIVLGLAAALEPRAIAKASRLLDKLRRRPPFWEIRKGEIKKE